MNELTQKEGQNKWYKNEQGNWCRKGDEPDLEKSKLWTAEAIALLGKYKNTGLSPEQIKKMDSLYLEKCREVTALRKRLEWIPVEERMPALYESVVVCDEKGAFAIGRYFRYGWSISNVLNYRIIAWMPLPEPCGPTEYTIYLKAEEAEGC